MHVCTYFNQPGLEQCHPICLISILLHLHPTLLTLRPLNTRGLTSIFSRCMHCRQARCQPSVPFLLRHTAKTFARKSHTWALEIPFSNLRTLLCGVGYTAVPWTTSKAQLYAFYLTSSLLPMLYACSRRFRKFLICVQYVTRGTFKKGPAAYAAGCSYRTSYCTNTLYTFTK